MGQFKPMVKMATTEPSIELKLKKGGAVKKADGGAMVSAMPSTMPSATIGAPRGGALSAMAPKKPSLAMRRRAMMTPTMKEGGESKAEHMAEMKKMSKVEKELKSHESKPASKAHKGLKTGGVAKSPKPGEYATGGVVMGQGGYKKGGKVKKMAEGGVPKSGIINTEGQGGKYRNTLMHEAKVDHDSAPTGEVKLGKPGGYKKGGSAKKAYATGGLVDTGKPVAMPKKKASTAVHITKLSGTFKKGGRVKKYEEGGQVEDLSKGAFDASLGPTKDEMAIANAMRSIPSKMYKGAKRMLGLGEPSKQEAKVIAEDTKTKTGAPAKKRGGRVSC